MNDAGHTLLMRLLDEAVPFTEFAATRPQRPQPRERPSSSPTGNAPFASDMEEGIAAVRYLLASEKLSIGGYTEWMRLQLAFKNSYGEDGYAPWLAFSEEADGFESEEACRKQWDGHKQRAEGAPLTIATYIAQAKEAGWTPPRRSNASKSQTGEEGDTSAGKLPSGVDAASHAVDLAIDAGDEFWVDQTGKPHVTYEASLPDDRKVSRHAPVSSEAYRGVLQHRFHEAVRKKVLTNDQTSLAVQLLGFKAAESGVQHNAALRVAERDGRVYVDLGTAEGTAVEVGSDDWRVTQSAPVRFVRGTRGELPVPERGGTLEDFARHFNLSPDDLLRLIGFLVGTFNVGGAYSILFTDGEQGSYKSTLCDKAVNLIDPPRQFKGARMAFSAKEQDLQIGALGVHVPYFDNVSTFTPDAADALCRMSTGGGSGARTLYTDTGYTEISVTRPIIINAIGLPSARPDLLSRSVRITAQSLQDHRRTERQVIRLFRADQGKLIGFLLTCVSAALRNRDMVEDAVERGDVRLPRMADFAEWVEGAHEVLGIPLGGFSKLLDDGQSAMQTEAVLGQPLGAGLVGYFSEADSKPLNASAKDILTLLRGRLGISVKLPSPSTFSKTLKRLSVGLRALGVEWSASSAEGHANVQRYRIWATESFEPIEIAGDASSNDGGGHF